MDNVLELFADTKAKATTPSLERQQWLERAFKELRAHFRKAGHDIPDNVRVSIGWPHGSRGGKGAEAIGQCWYDVGVSDKHYELFISPSQGDGCRIIDILAHEICHVIAGPKAKHGPKFKAVAVSVGLAGMMTATVAGDDMKAMASATVRKIGPYPGGRIAAGKKIGKQGTRLIKCQCAECGYTVRTTRKWLDDVGEPRCAVVSHGSMDEA